MKQHNKNAKAYESTVLDELLSLVTPEELARTESRMMLSAKIADAMAANKIGKKQFAELVGQSPSVITKWLSGGHNFTIDTLTDIQRVLGVRLLALDEKPVPEIRYQVSADLTARISCEIPLTIGGSSFGMSFKNMVTVQISTFERQIQSA